MAPHFLHTLAVDVLVTAFGQPSRQTALVALAINMVVVLAILSLFTMNSIKVLFAAVPYGFAIGYGQYLRWRYVCWLLDRGSSADPPVIYHVVEWAYLASAAFVLCVFIIAILDAISKM